MLQRECDSQGLLFSAQIGFAMADPCRYRVQQTPNKTWIAQRRYTKLSQLLRCSTIISKKSLAHYSTCKLPVSDCCHCKFVEKADIWKKHLPLLLDGAPSDGEFCTWLKWRDGVGCLCCDAAGLDNNLAMFAVTSPSAFQLSNLKRHHMSKLHQEAVVEFGNSGNAASQSIGAPPIHAFEKMMELLAKGLSPTAGIDGVGRKRKIQKMIWCIREAVRRADETILGRAVCVTLVRDERASRLAIRFAAIDKTLTIRHGRLGQRRHFGTGALNITKATREVMQRAMTSNYNIPWATDETITSRAPVRSCFNQEAFDNLVKSTKMVAVDSASDEINSVRDMHTPADGSPPLAPNLEVIGRDKAHGSRRSIVRPWQADPVLKDMLHTFVTGKHSMIQKLDHSHDLRRMFTERCREVETGFLLRTKSLVSLRSAKHRFESLASPLGLWVVWYMPLLLTAREIVVMRTGVEVQCSLYFLSEISTEVCVLMAMLADASDDALEFTRGVDDWDNFDPSVVNSDVFCFLVRVSELYVAGKVTKTFGYTKYMLDCLKAQPLAVPTGTATFKTIGNRHGVPPSIINSCLQRLSCWVKLCVHVMRAEFPNFELIQALSIFNLDKKAKARRGGHDHQLQRDRDIKTLASVIKCDMVDLKSQVDDLEPIALQHHLQTGASNLDCWIAAIKRVESRAATVAGHPSAAIRYAVYRLAMFKPCTSRLEQDFSRIDEVLGKHRLNSTEETEDDIVKVLLDFPPPGQDRTTILASAREIWRQCYGVSREGSCM